MLPGVFLAGLFSTIVVAPLALPSIATSGQIVLLSFLGVVQLGLGLVLFTIVQLYAVTRALCLTSSPFAQSCMRQFSIHRPEARDYLFEWLFHRSLMREGLIPPVPEEHSQD